MDSKGIDISYWQGAVNWRQVKLSGVSFVIIRDGYGRTEDGRFREYVSGARSVGITIKGTYHFIYSLTPEEAAKEADFAVQLAEAVGLPKTAYIFSDYEYDTERYQRERGVTPTKDLCTAITRAFCERVRRRGYQTGIYLNQDYAERMYTPTIKHEFPIWLADYEGAEAFSCLVRQYSSAGRVSGIAGNVDLDIWHGTEVKPSAPKVPHIYYAVKTRNHGITPFVKDWKQSGASGDSITGVAIRATSGAIQYRAHVIGGGWLPAVTGCDFSDPVNGYAGDGVHSIDAVQVYYRTDVSATGGVYYAAKYQTKACGNSTYYPAVYDTNWEAADGKYTAGVFKRPVSLLRMKLIQL